MSISDAMKRVERRFPWSFLGVLLAVVFFALGTYLTLREKRPALTADVLTEANVFDVHKELQTLEILFNGENIKEKGLNLRILSIRITNSGDQDILQGYYDNSQDWGLLVSGARIVEEPRIVAQNSEYLLRNLNPRIEKGDFFVRLNKVILERGKYFTIEIMLLHKIGTDPNIRFVGKIAGVENPTVLWSSRETGKVSFLERVISGGVWVNLLRYLAAVLATIGLIIILVALSEWKDSLVKRRKIRSLMREVAPLLETLDTAEQSKAEELIKACGGERKTLFRLQHFVERNAAKEHDVQATELYPPGQIRMAINERGERIHIMGLPIELLYKEGPDGKRNVNEASLKVLQKLTGVLGEAEKEAKGQKDSQPIASVDVPHH